MKRLFLTFAAMLLMSVSAFAQSSETPLKGDVNEDGVVDVADINAIIAIIKNNAQSATTYYYVGQNPSDMYITDQNYTSIATQSAFTSKTIDMTTGNYLYVVVPSNKKVEITDPAGNGVTMNYYDTSKGTYAKHPNIATDGYYLIRSRATAFAEAWTVTITDAETDIFYFGTTQPTASNYTTLTPIYSSSSEVYGKTVNVSSGQYIYYLCPSTKALTTEQRKSAMLDGGGNIVKFSTDIDDTTISGYTIYKQFIDNASTMKFNINY